MDTEPFLRSWQYEQKPVIGPRVNSSHCVSLRSTLILRFHLCICNWGYIIIRMLWNIQWIIYKESSTEANPPPQSPLARFSNTSLWATASWKAHMILEHPFGHFQTHAQRCHRIHGLWYLLFPSTTRCYNCSSLISFVEAVPNPPTWKVLSYPRISKRFSICLQLQTSGCDDIRLGKAWFFILPSVGSLSSRFAYWPRVQEVSAVRI
jgi:hypothetical protein